MADAKKAHEDMLAEVATVLRPTYGDKARAIAEVRVSFGRDLEALRARVTSCPAAKPLARITEIYSGGDWELEPLADDAIGLGSPLSVAIAAELARLRAAVSAFHTAKSELVGRAAGAAQLLQEHVIGAEERKLIAHSNAKEAAILSDK